MLNVIILIISWSFYMIQWLSIFIEFLNGLNQSSCVKNRSKNARVDPSENELHRPYPVRSYVGKSLTCSPFFPPSSLVLFFCFVVVWPLVIITELWRCNETPTECFRWPRNACNEHVSKMLITLLSEVFCTVFWNTQICKAI